MLEALSASATLAFHAGHGEADGWHGSLTLASLAKLHNARHPAVCLSAGCTTARLCTLPPYEAYVDAAGREHRGTNAGEVFAAPPAPPACYQRGPHNPTSLGEQMLRSGQGGAAAYIGCDTGSQPCAMSLLAGFAAGMARRAGAARLGDCWTDALAFYVEHERLRSLTPSADWYPPSIFFQGMKFLLLGDPSLVLAAGGR